MSAACEEGYGTYGQKKKKKERGLELVKDGKNCTERTKDLVQEREQRGTVSLGMS